MITKAHTRNEHKKEGNSLKKIVMILLVCLLLWGCTGQPAEITLRLETTAPAETTASVTEPKPTDPEMPEISGLEPGYYLVSSVGKDGDVSFYGSMSPENGWLLLNEDGTGTFFFEGVEGELTWQEDALSWQGQTLMGLTARYYDSELGREDSMVMLYFTDPVVSVILRPASMPDA